MEDIRDSFYTSKILIAPMLISIGLQNKILQAMAMKIPCVISTMANNALGATHEKEVFVANTPEEYSRYIQLLLTDKEKYRQLTNAAYDFVRKNFNWEQCNQSSPSFNLSISILKATITSPITFWISSKSAFS